MWILFSDSILNFLIDDIDYLAKIQTYKGVFYVLITTVFFYLFMKKHLNKLRNTEQELEAHRKNLQRLVDKKTKDLDAAIIKLSNTNAALNDKNEIINDQNLKLKKTLKALKDTQSQLIQIEKMASLGVLTAGISHEINNPLNYILGGLTGLENHLSDEKINDEKVDLYLNSIKTGVSRATAIVSGLNQLSRNKETYEEDCDIHEIIDNCLTILSSQLKHKIEINKQFAEQRIIVSGNVGKLHQVFLNIIINANQSIEDKGTITLSTVIMKEKVQIDIEDTGCGISKENLSKITDPFFTTKEPGQGTGLGLAIAYNIIQAHKGTISFKSALNKGTSVKIVLPVKSHKK
jgi:C4-dicarboxylate-specific signal transduction histidine kinase